MAWRGDPTGVAQTCPLIDEVISFLNNIEWDEGEEELNNDSIRMAQVLEMIRKANTKLREFGHAQYERANENEKDLERASGRIDELEHTITVLEKECSSLTSEINDLQSQLQDE